MFNSPFSFPVFKRENQGYHHHRKGESEKFSFMYVALVKNQDQTANIKHVLLIMKGLKMFLISIFRF